MVFGNGPSFRRVTALIARIQTIEMPYHFALAMNNGVKPSELSEIITHLAFYSGWANAMSAVAVAKDIFHQRGIASTSCHQRKTNYFH
jgi:4-carboxymuconolactone decarboxylase